MSKFYYITDNPTEFFSAQETNLIIPPHPAFFEEGELIGPFVDMTFRYAGYPKARWTWQEKIPREVWQVMDQYRDPTGSTEVMIRTRTNEVDDEGYVYGMFWAQLVSMEGEPRAGYAFDFVEVRFEKLIPI